MPCHAAGFRHDSLHAPEASVAAPGRRKAATSGMKRVSSCPSNLKDPAAPSLIKPEYSRRNHKNFLDLYELGPVLGTGGYAVVRECVHKGTGAKFAAKMMTVSEHPESGGRDVDREVRHPALHAAAVVWLWLAQQLLPTLPCSARSHCAVCVRALTLYGATLARTHPVRAHACMRSTLRVRVQPGLSLSPLQHVSTARACALPHA
jgi:hypothetical protein